MGGGRPMVAWPSKADIVQYWELATFTEYNIIHTQNALTV